MMYNFCTLFDKNYFYKGLTMYNSLLDNCSGDFILWILCMDDITYELLEKMNLSRIRLISLKEFESPDLLKVKSERNVAEYSWTCASNFIWYLLQQNKKLEMITYLDADLYFFDDPKILISELGDDDVMITEHRYTKKYDQSVASGKYCVQFMIFKNNKNGLVVLDWWRRVCLDWCFDYADNDRFGDQKYLDNWTSKFDGVHELIHLGGGVAPWNVQQYDFFIKNGKIFGHIKKNKNDWPLVFYHFHGFRLISKKKYLPVLYYEMSRNVEKTIIKPYFNAIQKSIMFVEKFDNGFNYGYKYIPKKEIIISRLLNFIILRDVVHFLILIKNKLYGKKNKG